MRRNSLAWIVIGGCAFGLATMELAACSSDSGGTGTPSGGSDATTTKDGTTGEGGAKDDGSTTKEGGSTDAGADCGKPPTLHPRAIADGGDGGPIMNFLCPFSSPSGSKPDYCTSGTQHCCVSYTVGTLSTCETSCPAAADGGPFNGRDFACLDPIDCAGHGGVCCGIGQVLQDQACGDYFGKSFKGTKCATSCNDTANEFPICQSDSQCTGGKTCTPMSAVGAQFGFCQ